MKKQKVKYHPQFKKQVLGAVEHYTSLFHLNHVGSVFYMDNDEMHDGMNEWACADIDEKYLKTDYKIFPIFQREWRKKKVSERLKCVHEIIAHEVSHCVTEPLYLLIHQTYRSKNETERTREQLTEVISRVANRTWQRPLLPPESKPNHNGRKKG